MGFALWIEDDIARAQGTHEYRPMGVATISVTDVFRQRDFHPRAAARWRSGPSYVGLFASLGEVNHFLTKRRSQPKRKSDGFGPRRALPII